MCLPRKQKIVLVLAFFFFIFIHRETYSLGFFGEDFGWLRWSRKANWLDVFTPDAGVYFRPFSVRLPYFLLQNWNLPLWVWKLFVFLTIGLCLWFLQKILQTLKISCEAALFISLWWLFAPFHSFGIYYVNALDYTLFLFALILYLYATFNHFQWRALVFLIFALGVKEIAVLFPLIPLFTIKWDVFMKRKTYFVQFLLVFLFCLATGLWSIEKQEVSGFALGYSLDRLFPVLMIKFQQFLGIQFHPFPISPGFLWTMFSLFCGAIAIKSALNVLEYRRAILGICGATFCFFLPAFILPDVDITNLTGLFWTLILPVCAIGVDRLFQKNPSKFLPLVLLPILLWYAISSQAESIVVHRQQSGFFTNGIAKVAEVVGRCPQVEQWTISGLDTNLFRGPIEAEHLVWGLMDLFPEKDFFLQKTPGSSHQPISAHIFMWEVHSGGRMIFSKEFEEWKVKIEAQDCVGLVGAVLPGKSYL